MTRTLRQAGCLGVSIALAIGIAAQWPARAATPTAPDVAAPRADLVRAGRELAQVGAMTDPTPPCVSCHGLDGHGVGVRIPNIAGQPAAFLVERLHEFQAQAKAKTPDYGTMPEVASHLNETQIAQVAAYLSTLP